jgi:hypothetical protein
MAEPMMQFFKFDHLPEHLQGTSSWFWDVACMIEATLPHNPERTSASIVVIVIVGVLVLIAMAPIDRGR